MVTIKLLDGADGYLRKKESVLLHLHGIDVAHVLLDKPPPARAGGDCAQAAKKWARDDGLCRDHILAALSDRLLLVYIRHATGRAPWRAVAHTYEPDATSWELSFEELEFREDETLRGAGRSSQAREIRAAREEKDRINGNCGAGGAGDRGMVMAPTNL